MIEANLYDEIKSTISSCTERIAHMSKERKSESINVIDEYLQRDDVKNHPMYSVIVLCMTLAQNELRKAVAE